MRTQTGSTQRWIVLSLLFDVLAFLAALIAAHLVLSDILTYGEDRYVSPFDLVVVAIALASTYLMGLYRIEALGSSDLRVPLFAAFVLATVFMAGFAVATEQGESIPSRWLGALPLAFTLIFLGRRFVAQLARVDETRLRLEKEKRQTSLDGLGRHPSSLLHRPARSRLSRGVKRAIDISFCAALLLFTLPVSLAAMLAIWIEDGRPIFYRQRRVGKGGQVFWLYKFRSMRSSAESDGVARWARQNDDRITRVGRFLRRSRIDEFPQFINVLIGDMSLVGPRPERPEMVADLGKVIPQYACRHIIKPGITGWAQINYPYGASVADTVEKTKLDFYYIKHGSIILDLLIILQTIRVILMAEGSR